MSSSSWDCYLDYTGRPVEDYIDDSDDGFSRYDSSFENDTSKVHDAKYRSCKLANAIVRENSQQDSDDENNGIEIKYQQTSANFAKTQGQKIRTSNVHRKFSHNLSDEHQDLNGTDEINVSNKKLTEDAVTISKLLPKYKYNCVFEALFKNRKAKNYIELTLWDLLPAKRPPAQKTNYANDFGSLTNIDTKDEELIVNNEAVNRKGTLKSFHKKVSLDSNKLFATGNSVERKEQIIAGTKKKQMIRNEKDNNENSISNLNDENWSPDLMQLYVYLTCKFPNVDQKRLNDLIRRYRQQNPNATFSEQLDDLISIVGKNKADLVKKDATELQSENDAETEEKYKYLSDIFQDADPDYLKKVVARMCGNAKALEEFVQTQMENPTYITKEEKLKRKNIARYTTNFNVKQFLELFQDPVEFFENKNRKCAYNAEAFEFLKFQFKQFEELTITEVYDNNKYNLTLTACALQNMEPNIITAHTSSWKNTPSENIPLLQEIAYIQHRSRIKEEFDKLKEREAKELDLLIQRNEFLECQCCYAECIPSKCLNCNDGHVFCDLCVQRGADVTLGQGNTRISCFVSDCTSEFSLSMLKKALKPMRFSLLLRKRQEAEVMAAGLEGLVACPFCHFASIPPPEDKIFKCLNPECLKESCRYCREINHLPLKCYEEKSDKARLLLEEKMTEALLRKCYNCGHPYVKKDGCNKITCSCGALMCYICGKAINGYNHFNEIGGCQLHTNNDIDAATVKVVAKKVAERIKEEDPNVDIDINSLLMHMPNVPDDMAISGRVNNVAYLKK